MKVANLSKSVVDALAITPKPYIAWCGEFPGFGVSVRPTGSKSFVFQYDFGGRRGTTRRVTIGTYGKPWTVDEARKHAKGVLKEVRSGNDPAAKKTAIRTGATMNELCDHYLLEGCGHKKPSTLATDRGSIERHIKKLLGDKRVKEITKIDVQRFASAVASGKSAADIKTKKHGRALVRGGQGAANRTVRLLGAIFSFAIEHGYRDTNPRTGVKDAVKDRKCERFLLPNELQRLGETLREAETIGLPWQFNENANAKHRAKPENAREKINPYAIAAIRLLMFTGMRSGEVLKLRWSEVDFERGVLNLPDSKTGKKKVIIGAPALQLLANLPRVAGNPFVIVGEKKGEHRHDLQRPWQRIIAHAALDGRDDQPSLRIHDLRHGFASVGAASGLGLPIVGMLLGHSSTATTARYAHIANDPARAAADRISATIAAAMGTGDADNVVPIKSVA